MASSCGKKRSKPADSSSDFNSSGPPRKRLNKPPQLERRSPKARAALQERSANLSSTPVKTHSRQDHPKTPQPLPSAATELNQSEDSLSDQERCQVEEPLNRFRLRVIAHLEARRDGSDIVSDLSPITEARTQEEIATILSDRGWWSPSILSCFEHEPIWSISLTGSIKTDHLRARFFSAFFSLGTFVTLSNLNLSRITITVDDISSLRLLPALETLNLSSTDIGTHHLLHLATHAQTLFDLNISGNPLINDDARVPLTALWRLTALHLRGTSITMSCLRSLVYALPLACRLITLPQPCLSYLNARGDYYSTSIPLGYVQDPRHVPNLTLEALKKNLALHKAVNRDVMLTGSKIDLVDRLRGLLCRRVADAKVAKQVGRA
ncbi:MAG: hypothetical protein M1819_006924 [Sarea resinae]|nr:MAG: hypothetical protein M1819_006924 [Sarea resinae]